MARTKDHPIDIAVGRNVMRIRRVKGLSQSTLGAALGITFQQVQKYETGANRISASTLFQLSRLLHVTMDELFTGADGAVAEDTGASSGFTTPLLSEVDQILNPDIRKAVRGLVKTLSRDGAAPEEEASFGN